MRRKNGLSNQDVDFAVSNVSEGIPFLTGRPERDGIIHGDDITNLRIALHTCINIDEFIMHV